MDTIDRYSDQAFERLIGLMNRAFSLPVSREADLPDGNDAWKEVLALSVKQRVLPLVVSLFGSLPQDRIATGPTAVKAYLLTEQTLEKQQKRFTQLERLCRIFSQQGLDVMFLKGATLSVRYPSPQLRFFGDIDYYLFGQSRRGEEVLAAAGIRSSAYYHHHTQGLMDGILLENHYDFLDLANHKCNRVLDEALKEMAPKERMPLRIPGIDLPAGAWRMSPTMEAVFLMRHMSAHFAASETELRQIYDWVLLVRSGGSQVDWWKVCRLYDASGMMPFAQIVCWIIREKLCLDLALPIKPVGGPLAERVWADIVRTKSKNAFRRGSLRYYLREARVLLQNRWKYKLVYPDESFTALVFNMLKLKLKLGR